MSMPLQSARRLYKYHFEPSALQEGESLDGG